MAPDWLNFGLKLNVQYRDLKIIERNNPRDCVACLREALFYWLSQNSDAGLLVEALKENKRLLKHIKHALSQGDHRKGEFV